MPPPGYEPFLRAICADPGDDTARLVYADWLDENDDPDRAEFIRLQVAVPERPEKHDPRHTRYMRAIELQKRHRATWAGELPRLSGINWPFLFRRGFVSEVQVSDGKWLLHHREQIFRATPVQFLTLHDAGLSTLQKVLDLSEFEQLLGLSFQNCRVMPGQWSALTECPRLAKLKRLAIDPAVRWGQPIHIALSDGDAEELVNSPHLAALESVRINGSVSPAALAALRARFKTAHARS